MADEIITITNNVGDDKYNQSAREFLANPIKVDTVKVILNDEGQLDNIIRIKNSSSFGSLTNRDISLRNYINAKNSTNLILDIPLDPPMVLDGTSYFQTDIEPQSQIELLFSYEQMYE